MTKVPRWGILSTARIASTAFLPAVRASGQRAVVVGGRDLERTRAFAERNGVDRAVAGYEAVVVDPDIDAVYIPLPNSLHGEWTIRALDAGKAVLCEKPLCANLAEARKVIDVARTSARPLWEAFVFPFHVQAHRVEAILASGVIGSIGEIQAQFHFQLVDQQNIRMAAALGGGALYDVGCYPIRFAQLIFSSTPEKGIALASWADSGVDTEMQGVLEFPGERRLILSCGMRRNSGTLGRIVGTDGEVTLTNPFHARDFDTLQLRSAAGLSVENLGSSAPSFTDALSHIAAVLSEDAMPIHTAVQDSLATEVGLDILMRSARSGEVEHSAA